MPDAKSQRRNQQRKKVPRGAGIMPERVADEPAAFTNIRFDFYSKPQCQIDDLVLGSARKGLQALRLMGSGPPGRMGERNIRMQPIPKAQPQYAPLFSGLSGDVEKLSHHNISSVGRIFFFLSGSNCQIVAIRKDHY